MPHLDHCVTVWGDCNDVARLEKLQKQIARIILDSHYLTPSKDMFSKLRWLPLKDCVKYRKATMTYKAVNGKAPDYIIAMFRYGQLNDVTERHFTKKWILSVVYTIPKHSVRKLNIIIMALLPIHLTLYCS